MPLKTPESSKDAIQSAILALYETLAAGKDVSPSARFRLEGKIELLIEQGLLDKKALQAWISEAYEKAFGAPLKAVFWQISDENPGFTLPVKMMEAPVYKG